MVKIYASWTDCEIMTEKEYQERLGKYLDNHLNDKYLMDRFFSEAGYTAGEVWTMDKEKRERVTEEAREWLTEFYEEMEEIGVREILTPI